LINFHKPVKQKVSHVDLNRA